MASISKRTTAIKRNGRPVVKYDVRWRERGKAQSRTFGTEAAAKVFKAKVESGTLDAAAKAPQRGGPTVRSVHATWLASRRVSRGRASAERSYAKNVLAALGDVLVVELAASDVKSWVAAQVDAGNAPETIAGRLRMLRQILDSAVEDEIVGANVAARVKAPTVTRPPLDTEDVLDPAEVARLIDAVPDRWRALVGVLSYMGPRWSEALGLDATDIDLLRRRVRFGRNVLEETDGMQYLRPGGKTRNADRWTPIPAPLVPLLEHHLSTYQPNRAGLVFVGEYGGAPYRSGFRARVLNPALAETGLTARGITMRQLRHTSVSNALAAGVQPVTVARWHGHAKPSMTTDVYARFIPSSEDAETAVYEAHLGGQDHHTTIAHHAGSGANE